jgi:cobalamin biosynthesis protein CbiG
MAKQSNNILAWARRGAEVRWNELQAEVASLLKAFPDLTTMSNTARRTLARSARGVAETLEPTRKRSTMSAAQRKAVSARMKKYWRKRRKATVQK